MPEISDILIDNDFIRTVVTTGNLGPTLTRAEILAALTENSIPFPAVSVSFILINSVRIFNVYYNADLDKYFYVEILEAE